ncbi:hypothetical protein COL39_03610 [Bacillus cereus]|uniref:LPO_1073/Vpar_1526 family protein n=1 Tax=Bacillus cereus TaxID=1396 RepID=UPI000BF700AB|nr:LPO_1073/Vpar_1526 family protein [Bacillus cereus]PFX76397.1 hypothetical protein COL39_03610 [Bacillus cereus]
MIGNKKEIHAGDDSTNIQAQNVTIQHNGLSYTDVKEVAMEIFKSNFYNLGKTVENTINERAEEIINKYLDRLVTKDPESLKNTEDPDLRFSIYEMQKNHARRGDAKIADLLVDMLVNRTMVKEEEFLKLIYNESMMMITKLTSNQIDILTVIFFVRYVNSSVFQINEFAELLMRFAEDVPNEVFFYQHLQYAGCISISVVSLFDLVKHLKENFPDLVPSSVDYEDRLFNRNLKSVSPKLFRFSQKWNKTKICNSSLTSVGIAIAIANFNRITGSNWDVSEWITGLKD